MSIPINIDPLFIGPTLLFDILLVLHLIFTYLATVLVPSPVISHFLKKFRNSNIEENCGGKANAGKYIGYAERSLIYLIFVIAYVEKVNMANVLNTLSLIIAGKGLFRATGSRECAEWYILGTFLSIFLGTLITWVGLESFKIFFIW